MIIEFNPQKWVNPNYFSVSWLSNYPVEKEYFFFQNFIQCKFQMYGNQQQALSMEILKILY